MIEIQIRIRNRIVLEGRIEFEDLDFFGSITKIRFSKCDRQIQDCLSNEQSNLMIYSEWDWVFRIELQIKEKKLNEKFWEWNLNFWEWGNESVFSEKCSDFTVNGFHFLENEEWAFVYQNVWWLNRIVLRFRGMLK